MNFFSKSNNSLIFKRRQEIVEITPWGNGLRLRATQNHSFSGKDWALDIPCETTGTIKINEKRLLFQMAKLPLLLQNLEKFLFIIMKISYC